VKLKPVGLSNSQLLHQECIVSSIDWIATVKKSDALSLFELHVILKCGLLFSGFISANKVIYQLSLFIGSTSIKVYGFWKFKLPFTINCSTWVDSYDCVEVL